MLQSMIRSVLTLWLLTLVVSHAEIITRAYYVGKIPPGYWQPIGQVSLGTLPSLDSVSPAPVDSLPEIVTPKPLKKAPFESPLFREGDVLYDFKQFKKQVEHVQGKLEHAIYNETTGRIVVRGEPLVHTVFQALSAVAANSLPKIVELDLEFVENDVPLFQTSLRANPGQKVLLETGEGPNQLSIDWEAAIDHYDDYVEARLKMDGTIREQMFKLHTGLIGIKNVSQEIPLGAVEESQPILDLKIIQRVLLPGDVPRSDLVLDKHGKAFVSRSGGFFRSPALEEGLTDSKTGKILRGYRLPPNFILFISTPAGDVEAGDDPFSTEDDESDKPLDFIYLTEWDPRIPVALSDRMVDCQQLLQNSGVPFDDADFAVLNLESDTLYVQGSSIVHDLFDAIVKIGHPHPPRLIGTNLKLIESLEKPGLESLSSLDHKTLATVSTISLPGQTATLELGEA